MRESGFSGTRRHRAEHDRFLEDLLELADAHDRRAGPAARRWPLSAWLWSGCAGTSRAWTPSWVGTWRSGGTGARLMGQYPRGARTGLDPPPGRIAKGETWFSSGRRRSLWLAR